jgi:hypothetical protein
MRDTDRCPSFGQRHVVTPVPPAGTTGLLLGSAIQDLS